MVFRQIEIACSHHALNIDGTMDCVDDTRAIKQGVGMREPAGNRAPLYAASGFSR